MPAFEGKFGGKEIAPSFADRWGIMQAATGENRCDESRGDEVNAVVRGLRSVDACARAYFRIGLLSHLRRRPDPSAGR